MMAAGKPIDALYAWIVTQPDGSEDVGSVMIGGIQHQMIGADVHSIRSFREHVEFLYRETGYRVRLVRFAVCGGICHGKTPQPRAAPDASPSLSTDDHPSVRSADRRVVAPTRGGRAQQLDRTPVRARLLDPEITASEGPPTPDNTYYRTVKIHRERAAPTADNPYSRTQKRGSAGLVMVENSIRDSGTANHLERALQLRSTGNRVIPGASIWRSTSAPISGRGMVETLPAIDLAQIGARAAELARTSRSAATERAYRSDWADFSRWCELAGLIAPPAEATTVGAYLSDRADRLKVATLNRRIAAITAAHRMAGQGFDGGHPAIAGVLGGIRRRYGTKQDAKTAILTEDLRWMVRALPATLTGVRDRAVLLVGFAGAFRRSELVAIDLGDVKLSGAGLVITIGRSKTDQEGCRPRCRDPAGAEIVDHLPGGGARGLASRKRKVFEPGHQNVTGLPGDRSRPTGRAPLRPRGRRDRQVCRSARRARSDQIRRAFAAQRLCHFGGAGRGGSGLHHATDRAQECRCRPALCASRPAARQPSIEGSQAVSEPEGLPSEYRGARRHRRRRTPLIAAVAIEGAAGAVSLPRPDRPSRLSRTLHPLPKDRPADIGNLLSMTVCRLRQKLAGTPLRIEAIWGHGYRLWFDRDLAPAKPADAREAAA